MLFYFACEAAGASSARHSLLPLFLRGEWIMHDSGAGRRGNVNGCLKIGCDTFRCHHPRKRMIQYSTDTDDQSRRRSVLDTPPSRGMTPNVARVRPTSPHCGRGRIASSDAIRVRGCGVSMDLAPHPNPLPQGERELTPLPTNQLPTDSVRS